MLNRLSYRQAMVFWMMDPPLWQRNWFFRPKTCRWLRSDGSFPSGVPSFFDWSVPPLDISVPGRRTSYVVFPTWWKDLWLTESKSNKHSSQSIFMIFKARFKGISVTSSPMALGLKCVFTWMKTSFSCRASKLWLSPDSGDGSPKGLLPPALTPPPPPDSKGLLERDAEEEEVAVLQASRSTNSSAKVPFTI